MYNKKQDRLHLVLSNLQAIVINTVVCILCDVQFFSKQFDTFPKIGNGFYSLVQCV